MHYMTMEDIKINSKGVHKHLKNLKPHNAIGPDSIPSFTGATRYRNLIDIVSSQLTTFLEALLYHLEKSDLLPYKGVNSKYILATLWFY
jgi:hypothetical protein